MDWRLGLFRFGLFACIIWSIVVATQFDIGESVVAVWNHNPTAHSAQLAVTRAAARQSACLSAQARSPKAEFPSSCFFYDPTIRGMPNDEGIANLKGFLLALLPLGILLFAVTALGIRMSRESRNT